MKIIVPKETAKKIDYYLSHEPVSEEECFGEDSVITYTAKFEDGMEMDVKLCGVQYEEEGSNLPWTEAVLFRNGCQVACSEVCDDFFRQWVLEYKGKPYFCIVERGGV